MLKDARSAKRREKELKAKRLEAQLKVEAQKRHKQANFAHERRVEDTEEQVSAREQAKAAARAKRLGERAATTPEGGRRASSAEGRRASSPATPAAPRASSRSSRSSRDKSPERRASREKSSVVVMPDTSGDGVERETLVRRATRLRTGR